jgi:hypothetical protein
MSENDKRPDDPGAPWPDDEAPPSEAERLAAEQFRESLEADAAPAEPELRELHAAAGMLRASVREEHLSPAERDRLVREALSDALLADARPSSRLRRLGPVLALAASVLLLIGSLLIAGGGPLRAPRSRPGPAPRELSRSRPSNDLLGGPIEDRAGAARRLDLVFADRLAGYRARLLAAGGTRPGEVP